MSIDAAGIMRDAVYASGTGYLYMLGTGFGGGVRDGLEGVTLEVQQERLARRVSNAKPTAVVFAVASFIVLRICNYLRTA
mmetsp:Transcript_14034/g.28043  ORF Transcript_14034/g.28043 Transcript_14034/m.28043 type:complete len:80 (+) Transcript_14034:2-241(+)